VATKTKPKRSIKPTIAYLHDTIEKLEATIKELEVTNRDIRDQRRALKMKLFACKKSEDETRVVAQELKLRQLAATQIIKTVFAMRHPTLDIDVPQNPPQPEECEDSRLWRYLHATCQCPPG
jgi:septal ring factor EnvC (AmiA/AmiB activator)